MLRHEPSFGRLRDNVIEIAAQLEEQRNIPMVRAQLPLIAEVQTDEWWQDVTLAMLEDVRKKLRSLVRLIERSRRNLLYTDFTDEIGDEQSSTSSVSHPGCPWTSSERRCERFSASTKTTLPSTG